MQSTSSVTKAAFRRLKNTKPALFVCDVQEKFRPRIHQMDHVIHTSKFMINVAKKFGMPIIVTEQYPKGLGATVEEIKEIIDEQSCKLFTKTRFSMLTPEVESHFKSTGADAAIIVGIEAHVCVQQTVLDLLERGVDVWVISDGVSSQRPIDRSTAIDLMRSLSARITTSESAAFELLEDATHSNFKQVSAWATVPRPTSSL
eukprot:TRINITY_DN15590_c0_g1_i1.p1 TRINITY_DN15590_c0_g1~~TRINITY_DN15590_c0_g1_i1.p1  ORF type:complete len:202 (-),score=33.25 TRINITY_DN15590_c0_g1_i1:13-618(-)